MRKTYLSSQVIERHGNVFVMFCKQHNHKAVVVSKAFGLDI